MPSVDIVIVNWNAGPQLRECIESIFAHESDALKSVVVIDNASRDGSADFCRDDPRVWLIESGSNLGFGTACNLGAARGAADYILFLNPDTRLNGPTLGAVSSFMDRPESAGVGVCGVRLVGEAGQTWRHCSRFPTPGMFLALSAGLSKLLPSIFLPLELVEFDHLHDSRVPHVMGAFYCVRRHVFAQVDGFDEGFFVYHEDMDLSLRISQAGYAVQYLAGPAIYHRTAGTTGPSVRAKALSYLLESRLRYAWKHFGLGGRILVIAGVLVLEPVRRLLHALAIGRRGEARETIKAMGRVWLVLFGCRPDRT